MTFSEIKTHYFYSYYSLKSNYQLQDIFVKLIFITNNIEKILKHKKYLKYLHKKN